MSPTTAAQLVQQLLQQICNLNLAQAAQSHPRFELMWQTISDYLLAGGKRFRPYLTILLYECYSGKPANTNQSVLGVATAWELLHASMLMHDDIIDRDYTRHGRPNIAGAYLGHYNSVLDDGVRTHAAMSAALLAGDLVLSAAHQILDTCDLEVADLFWVKQCMDKATSAVIAGELLDTEVTLDHPDIDLGLIAELKTASYSLVAPMQSGAKLAGADDAQLKIIAELGVVLGRGYQLADDILGVFGDEQQTGKSTTSDLVEGKRTMVTVTALRLMDQADAERAEALLEAPSEHNAHELRQLITATNVEQQLHAQLDDFIINANRLIDNLAVGDSSKQQLKAVAVSLLKRAA